MRSNYINALSCAGFRNPAQLKAGNESHLKFYHLIYAFEKSISPEEETSMSLARMFTMIKISSV